MKNFTILFSMCCEEFVMKNFFTAFSCENSSLFVEHCPNLCLSDLSLFRDSSLDRTPKLDRSFRVWKQQETDSEHFFKFSGVPRKNDLFYFVSQQVSLCYRLHLQGTSPAGHRRRRDRCGKCPSEVCCQ